MTWVCCHPQDAAWGARKEMPVHAKGEFVKSAGKDSKKDGDSNQFVQGAIAAHRVGERQCLGCVVVQRIRAGQLLSGKVKYTAVCKALEKYDKVHTTPALRPSPPSQTTHTRTQAHRLAAHTNANPKSLVSSPTPQCPTSRSRSTCF